MTLSYRLAIHHGAPDDPHMRVWSLDDLRFASGGVAPVDELGEGDAAAIAAVQASRDAEARRQRQLEEEQATRELELAEAYERGRADGRAEGELAERAHLRSVTSAAEQALAEIREHEAEWAATMEPNVAALAVAIAKQLLDREIASDPQVVVSLVRSALAEFPIDQTVRVRLNPFDLERLCGAGAQGTVDEGRPASWLADVALTPGSCIVEGRERIVDGRVDTALERLYRRLAYHGE